MNAAHDTIFLLAYSGTREEATRALAMQFRGEVAAVFTRHEFKNLNMLGRLRALRSTKSDTTVVFCEDIRSQHHLALAKLLGVGTVAKRRFLLDGSGSVEPILLQDVLFREIPKLMLIRCAAPGIMLLITLSAMAFGWLRRFLHTAAHEADATQLNREMIFLRTDFGQERTGGAASHISGFLSAMLEKGWRVLYISPSGLPEIKNERITTRVTDWHHGLDIYCVELSQLLFNLRVIKANLRFLRRQDSRFIYHRASAFNVSGVLLSLLLRKPLILEFNSSALWKTSSESLLRFRFARKMLERVNLLSADAVCVVSEILRRELMAQGVPERKILVNRNGADPALFHPGVESRDIPHGRDGLVVGFTGHFSQWHGIETLIRCVPAVIEVRKDIHFLLVGDGPMRDHLESLVAEEGVDDFITFLGRVPRPQVPGYLAACDILASPHRCMADGGEFFGSPVKIFEYMAMGKAIIASRVGQLAEIIRNEVNGLLVDPEDDRQLADAILRLASDGRLRESLGAKAREDLVQRFTWSRNCQNIIDLWRDLARVSEMPGARKAGRHDRLS